MASYTHSGGYNQNLYDYTNMNSMHPSQTNHQPWSQGQSYPQTHSQLPPQIQQPHPHPYPDSTYYPSSINPFAPTDSTIYPSPHPYYTTNANATQTPSPPAHTPEYQTHAINSIPDSWKGPDKRALLETLLETITSCDEERVAQVVAVVRTSETPEEAVSGICRVLGIGISGDGDGDSSSIMR
jgi:hypothetical protein